MRRSLHIAAVSAAFSIGFFLPDTAEILALPLAFIVFLLMSKISSLNLTLHHLKVAVLTLVIWTPFAALILNALPRTGSCTLEFSDEEMAVLQEEENEEQVIVTTEPK